MMRLLFCVLKIRAIEITTKKYSDMMIMMMIMQEYLLCLQKIS